MQALCWTRHEALSCLSIVANSPRWDVQVTYCRQGEYETYCLRVYETLGRSNEPSSHPESNDHTTDRDESVGAVESGG
jgi:hypothetical protein